MRKQVTRLWRWSRSTVRFADQSISREVTLSRQSRTSGWQRFVGYSMQYILCLYWTCLWTYDSNLLMYVLLLYSLWAILYSASFWLKMIRRYFFYLIPSIYFWSPWNSYECWMEVKGVLLNISGASWWTYINIEFSYDLSLQIFKYLDSVDVDDSDVKAGYSIHLVSTIFSCSYVLMYSSHTATWLLLYLAV